MVRVVMTRACCCLGISKRSSRPGTGWTPKGPS